MFLSPTVNGSGSGEGLEGSKVGVDFFLGSHSYDEGDFVEDGSFLVLNTDGLGLFSSAPSQDKLDYKKERSVDSLLLHGYGEVESMSRDNQKAIAKSVPPGVRVCTDTPLMVSGEGVSILIAENKKFADLLADSNEKMKQCISTIEKLKADHEDYKKKHEASRETISKLRRDNAILKSELAEIQSRDLNEASKTMEKELAAKQEALEKKATTISELTERLQTVLTVNGQLNDELQGRQMVNQELNAELERMQAEIDIGRQKISKLNDYKMINEQKLSALRVELNTAVYKTEIIERFVEEKTQLVQSLRRSMEHAVRALELVNQKLNQKEDEVGILITKIADISVELMSSFECTEY